MGCFDVPWKVCLQMSHWIVCAACNAQESASTTYHRNSSISDKAGYVTRKESIADLVGFQLRGRTLGSFRSVPVSGLC